MIQITDQEQRRRLYGAGKNDSEIARIENVYNSVIRMWRLRCGLPPSQEPKYSEATRIVGVGKEVRDALRRKAAQPRPAPHRSIEL